MTGRILIVQRDFARAARIENVLARAGFDVAIATSAADALILCRRGRMDTVLIDAEWAEGPTLCRTIRRDSSLEKVSVAGVSTAWNAAARLWAMDAEIDEFIVLPISDGWLVHRVGNLCQISEIKQNFARTALLAGFRDPMEARYEPRRPKVLLVDPNIRSADRLKAVLAPGYEVMSIAEEGRLRAHRSAAEFDVIVCDPGVVAAAGIDFHTWLRATDAFGCRAGLVVVGDCDDDLQQGAQLLEADDGLFRPVDRSELLCRVALSARKRSLIKDLRILEVRLELKSLLFRPTPVRIEDRLYRWAA